MSFGKIQGSKSTVISFRGVEHLIWIRGVNSATNETHWKATLSSPETQGMLEAAQDTVKALRSAPRGVKPIFLLTIDQHY